MVDGEGEYVLQRAVGASRLELPAAGPGGEDAPAAASPPCAAGYTLAASYTHWVASHSRALRHTFLVLVLVGAALSPLSLGNMTTTVPAVAGSDSDVANRQAIRYFPNALAEHVAAIVIQRYDGGAVMGGDGPGKAALGNLTRHVLDHLADLQSAGLVRHVDCWNCFALAPMFGRGFVSSDGKVATMVVTYDSTRPDSGRVLPTIRGALRSAPEAVRVQLEALVTGDEPVMEASIEGIIANLRDMDSVAFPAALICLGLVLRSARLMLIPVLAVCSAATLAFGTLMYPISCLCSIFILAGSLMMSLIIALSVDYCLFILTRFQRELAAPSVCSLPAALRVERALAATLHTAGHTVLVSGVTLVLAFAGLLLSRDHFMTSLGIASAVAIIAALVVTLVLIPAMLLSYPEFFCGARSPKKFSQSPAARGVHIKADGSALLEVGAGADYKLDIGPGFSGDVLHVDLDHIEQLAAELSSTRWYRFSVWMLAHRGAVALAVLAAFLWPLLRLPAMRLVRTPVAGVPRGNEAFSGFSRMHQAFGASTLWPCSLLVVPPDGETVFTQDFHRRVSTFLDDLPAQLPDPPGFSVQSILYTSATGRIPFETVQAAVAPPGGPTPPCNATASQMCALLRLGRQRLVNEDASAMLISVKLVGDQAYSDPWAEAGIRWMRALRAALQTPGPDRYYMVSNPASAMDTIDGVYASAALVVTATALAVFAVVGLSFRSLVIPLRLLPSIGLTIVWTYGAAVIVYQDGALAFLGLSSLEPIPGGIEPGVSWILPPLCFTVLTGLCLDYDIFVLSAVSEFRLAGFGDRDAILLGVSATGQTITVAGCIMLIAFSGLMLSKQLLLNQLSFFLVTCVLVDTFVVRTIVVPICMDVLGSASNWWPRTMPAPTRSLEPARKRRESGPVEMVGCPRG